MSVGKYPIDFESIQKGDVITEDVIERAMDCKVGTKQYEFRMMALGAMIWQRTGFVVKGQNYTQLRVLTDEEAVPYSAKTFRTGQRKMRRGHVQSQSIDVEELSEDSKRTLRNNIISQSRLLQAVQKERRVINAEANKNQLKD